LDQRYGRKSFDADMHHSNEQANENRRLKSLRLHHISAIIA
jgi:hypothetical protein